MGNCMKSSEDSRSSNEPRRNTLKAQERQGAKELKQNYNIDNDTKVLGAGAFGKVFLTFNKHNQKHQVAIKVMNKKKLKDHLDAIQEEVAILTKLDHPNIVKYYETYVDEKYIYLVMEYIDGGELFDKIAKQENQVFGEEMACGYMQKLFSALSHMHAQGVVHRDIKPENIMLTKDDHLKLIDFGLSKRTSKNQQMKTIAGTPYYMAPEVLDGLYDAKCDTWSLGVLLYVFMSGYLPFQGKNRNEVFHKIKNGKFHFDHDEFKCCSKEVLDLIKKLLTVNSSNRLSAQQALQHPWFNANKTGGRDAKINMEVLGRLQSFRGQSKLKKAAMNILVKMTDQSRIDGLREQFVQIDKDGTGMISAKELRQAIQQSDINIPIERIDEIIDEVDYFGNQKINYTEFLVATIDVKNFLDDGKLQALFSQFDTDNSGQITRLNIVTAMNKIGHDITQQELDEIMAEHDLEKNDVITFYEFKALLLDLDDVNLAKSTNLH